MKQFLCAAAIAASCTSIASPGDQWSVVAWDGAATNSFLWDYTEGTSALANVRQFNYFGSPDVLIHDVEYANNGQMYATGIYRDLATNTYVAGLFTVFEPTASLNLITSFSWRTEGDMGYDPVLNRLVIVGKGSGVTSFVQYDLNNFGLSTLWGPTTFDDVSGLAFESNGAGYFVDGKSNTGNICEMHAFANNSSTIMGPIGISGGITMGMDVNAADQMHFMTSNGSLFHLAGPSAAFVETATNSAGHLVTGMAFKAVPEPATFSLFALAGPVLLRRRRASN